MGTELFFVILPYQTVENKGNFYDMENVWFVLI